MWNAQTVGFLAWLNPHQSESRNSIHNIFLFFFLLKLVFLLLVLDFSFLFILFKRHSLKMFPERAPADSVSLVSHFYGTIKPNCNHDAFNKNSFPFLSQLYTKTSKESSNYPSERNPSISSQKFSLSLRDNQESQNAKGTKKESMELFVVAIVNEKYVQLSEKYCHDIRDFLIFRWETNFWYKIVSWKFNLLVFLDFLLLISSLFLV